MEDTSAYDAVTTRSNAVASQWVEYGLQEITIFMDMRYICPSIYRIHEHDTTHAEQICTDLQTRRRERIFNGIYPIP